MMSHAGHEEELSEGERCSDLCSATLENLSYDKSISSACIYWPNSLNIVMLEAGLVSQCCANNWSFLTQMLLNL